MRGKAAEISEGFFLLVTGAYLICCCVYNSTYVLPAYTFPNRQVFLALVILAAAAALLRAVLRGSRPLAGTVVMAMTAGVFFLAYRTGRELFLLMIPVLMIGAEGMDYRRILRVYVISVGSFLAVTVLCALTGVIPNLVYGGGSRFRSAWGNAYPTDFASQVLFLVMITWLAWDEVPEEAVGLGGALSLCAAMRIAGSRTSALCSILLLGFVLFRMLFRNRRENNAYSSSISKGFHFLLALSFVIIAAAYFAAMLLYAKGTHVGSVLDLVLSNRLQLTLEILRDQGLHAFGRNFPQTGLGGSTIAIGPEKYYFLDSSYPLLLIRYGWVLFLAAAALWTKMGLSAYRMKDRKLLYVMTVVAVHALSEHHFPDVQYNMLLVMPFAAIPNREAAEKEKTLPALVRAHPAGAICAAAFLAAFLWGLPLLLSRLRTVFGIRGTDTGFGELKATFWCFLLFLVVTGFCVFLCKTAEGLRKHNGGAWKSTAAAGICLVILAGIAARDSHIIKTASENHDLISEETAEAFQVMLSSAEGKVYTEELPEAVHKHFPGFSRSVLYGDDLARFQNVSVVVSLRDDRICFAKSGFLFTELSPELAVYSNDPSVIKAMEDAGHGWTDYDSAVRTVDLQRLAGFNGLGLSEEGGIILEAGERLRRGPYQDLYAGTYEVSLFLHIDDLETKAGETVCTLYATVLDGPVLTEETVTADCFDENGNATVKLRFETGSIRYLQLPVFSETEQRLEVTGITYQKIHR